MHHPAVCLGVALAFASLAGATERDPAASLAPGTRVRDSYEAYRRLLAAGRAAPDGGLLTAASRVRLARAPHSVRGWALTAAARAGPR